MSDDVKGKSRLSNFLYSGMQFDQTSENAQQVAFINIFSLLGLFPAIIFGLLHLKNGNSVDGIAQLVFGFVLLGNLFLLRISNKISLSASILSVVLLLPITTLVITGGIEGTGAFWVFSVPVAMFLLHGLRAASAWMVVFFATILIVVALEIAGAIDAHYQPVVYRQLLIALLVETAMVATYQYVIDAVRGAVGVRTNELIESMKKLKDEASIRAKYQTEAESNAQEIKEKNKKLEQTKLAMSNLLEDLREEKETIQELSIKDEALLKSIGEGMLATDEYGRIEKINSHLLEMFGLQEADVIGKGLLRAFPAKGEKGDDIPPAERTEAEAISTGSITGAIYTFTKSDGTNFQGGVTAAPYMVNGRPIGAVITIRDVTKEVAVDRAKTEFVSLASHQLRTPLTAINWYLEMLSGGDVGKLKKDQLEYVDEIYKANQRMVTLVNALLNVSRVDLGTFLVDPKPVDLPSIAETVISELEGQIKSKKHALKTEFDKKLKTVKADEKLMYIVFQNLISNAVKYTPEKGKITVRIYRKTKTVFIEVEDNGFGIPKEQQDKIFTKLFRADNVVAKDTDGTGLGLYILKAVIEESGGKVYFESEEDKGTKFTVELPQTGMIKRNGEKGLSAI